MEMISQRSFTSWSLFAPLRGIEESLGLVAPRSGWVRLVAIGLILDWSGGKGTVLVQLGLHRGRIDRKDRGGTQGV